MRGTPTSFWGKLERDETGTVVAWHPLIDHCADVAATCEALLRDTLLGARLAYLAGEDRLDEPTLARLAYLAALHDLGKHNVGFQNKAFPGRGPIGGHVIEAVELLGSRGHREQEAFYAALPASELDRWGDTLVPLLAASIAHHGRPRRIESAPFPASVWHPAHGLDPFIGVRHLANAATEWFPAAFDRDARPLPSTPAFQHAYAGLVMLADWLGSDRKFFDYSEPDDPPRIERARDAARDALARMGLAPATARRALGPSRPGFDCIVDFPPRAAQRAMVDLPEDARGSLTVLESETGSGKTEAALVRFARLFHAGLVDGLYFALPTRSAATQLHARVHQAAQRAFGADAPSVVLAVPGYLAVDDVEGVRLPGFEVLWNDGDPRFDRARAWAAESPKRFIVGAIVVGTIDQVLLSALTVDHAHLRATALSRHLLVVDEVHASDAYMTRLLEHVLEAHLAAGGHALLMSATLGSVAQQRLLGAMARVERRPATAPMSLDAARALPYPAITHRPRGLDPTTIAIREAGRRKQVCVELAALAEPADVASRALNAARRGALVLVIRNTVRDCIETQRALEALADGEDRRLLFTCAGVPAPHHARYARDDRSALDRALESVFGKHAPRTRGTVVVATQTVQQSLDLDADLLITDLCPMDVLLQRIGRLHRHDREHRPDGFETARCVVVDPGDLGACLRPSGEARGPHGFGRVYDDLRILEATRRALLERASLDIPGENRDLVERTTHSDALSALVRTLGGAWPAHATYLDGRWRGERRIADLNVIDRTRELGDFEFPSDVRIGARLGESDRLIEIDAALRGPFGEPVRRWTIAAWMCRDITTDAPVSAIEIAPGELELSLGAARFSYDRLGLRPSEGAVVAGGAADEDE